MDIGRGPRCPRPGRGYSDVGPGIVGCSQSSSEVVGVHSVWVALGTANREEPQNSPAKCVVTNKEAGDRSQGKVQPHPQQGADR